MALLTRYSDRIYGGITFTGNTLGLSRRSNVQEPGTLHIAGAYTTTDSTSQCHTFPDGTTCTYPNNSSYAVLTLPPDTEVVYAELIWSGTSRTPAGNVDGNLNDSIKFKPPITAEVDIFPVLETRFNEKMVTNSNIYCYSRSAIVTSYVQANGSGNYTVGKVPAFLDLSDSTSRLFGCVGWTLAVVYRYLTAGHPFRSITLYTGALAVVPDTAPATTTLTDFVTPNYDAITARLLLSAAEGDYNLTGDQAFFGTTGNANINTPLSGPNNQANNFFASQINGDPGVLNTTGTFGTVNHYWNGTQYVGVSGARQGWDITNIDVSTHINKNKNTATFKVSTNQDAILVNGAAIVIDTSEPKIELQKVCTQTYAALNDEVLYTIEVTNTGTATADTVKVTDSIPTGMSFVAGSVYVDGESKPALDIQVPNGVPLTDVAPGTPAIVISFKLKVDSVTGITEYKNQATAVYTYSLQPNPYTALSNYAYCYPVIPGLEVIKTATETVVAEGEPIHFQIKVKNTGDINLTNLTVVDILPAGIELDPSSVTVDGGPPVGSLDTGISISQIIKGAFSMIEFEAQALTAALAPFKNDATAGGFYTVNPGEAPRPIEDTSDIVIVDCIKTEIDKTVDKAYAQAGDVLTYTITFTNNSSVDMYGVKIADTYDAAKTTLDSASINPAPQPGETLATGITVGGVGGSVPKGTSATLTFKVTVKAGATGDIVNSATATFKYKDWKGIEYSGNVGPDTATTTIVAAGLEITKSANKTFVTAINEEVVYLLTIKNTGSVKITNITVIDTIPTGMAYVANTTYLNGSITPIDKSPAAPGINIGDLDIGGIYTIQFTLKVTSF